MKSIDELNAIKQEYKNAVAIRTDDHVTRIVVGMGNSGLIAGAREILKAFIKLVEDEDLAGKVIVTQAARVSRVDHNPTVEIVEDGVETALYANVTVEMAKRIVEEHIIGGKVIEEYLLNDEENEEE